MNNSAIEDKRQLVKEIIGSLDHAEPEEQMKVIHTALQQYFDAEDWLGERNRKFPGLFRVWHRMREDEV
jgi:hypothetical protein